MTKRTTKASKADPVLADIKEDGGHAAEIAKIRKVSDYQGIDGSEPANYAYTWPDSGGGLLITSYNTYEGLVNLITNPPKRVERQPEEDDPIAPKTYAGYEAVDGHPVAYVSGSLLRHDDATDEEWLAAIHLHYTGKQNCGDPGCWSGLDGQPCAGSPSLKKGRLKLTPASEIKVSSVTWLWQDRLAAGTVAVLTGRGDVGKTTLALTWAAMVSQGRLEGVYFGRPKSVIIHATEDVFAQVTAPRLMAAGANLDRVFRIDPVKEHDGVVLPRDVEDLTDLIAENDVALVIMDPLLSMIDRGLDTHKDAEIRRALAPLVNMAEATGATVLGFVHFNKGTSKDAIERVSASGALTNVPRSVFAVVKDDNDDVRVLGHIKNNLGVKQPDLAFTIETALVGTDDDGRSITAGKVVWQDTAQRSFQEIMETGTRPTRQGVGDWLREYLIQSGPTPAADVKAAAIAAGMAGSEKTVERAATAIGVKRENRVKPGVKGTYAVWSLDGDGEPNLLAGLR